MTADEFERLTTAFPEPHMLVSRSGEVAALNTAAAELLGRRRDESSTLRLSDLAVDPPEKVESYLAGCARSGFSIPGALTLRGADGEERRWRCDGARLTGDDAGALVALRFRRHEEASHRFLILREQIERLNREIHERRRAELELQEQATQLRDLAAELEQTIEELEEQKAEALATRAEAERANQVKTEFVAVMSHELRTPLNAIFGYSDLMDAEIAGPLTDRQREQLGRIRESGRHLLELVEEILAYSRLEAGKEEVRATDMDLARVAEDVAALLRPTAERGGIELRCEAPAGGVPLVSDPRMVRQILLNLVSNAVKFTKHGEVVVTVKPAESGGVVRVDVRDTGPGIPADQLDAIFEAFRQLDSSPTREHGGTGLGLSVARRLARLLGGDVSVRSELGEGSTFTITMPSSVELER